MTWMERLDLFSRLDLLGLLLLAICWICISWWIERASPENPSVSVLMGGFRHEWMTQMLTRQPRIFDSQMIGILRQGTAFFASATMLALGGGLALVGNPDPLAGLAQDFVQSAAPAFVWEVKLIVLLLILSNAFLKFVWAHRLFGYCAVVLAAVPNDPQDLNALHRAKQAAEIANTAARSFNRAMRAVYYSLATAAWILGPVPLMVATVITTGVLYRREFASKSRRILLEKADTRS